MIQGNGNVRGSNSCVVYREGADQICKLFHATHILLCTYVVSVHLAVCRLEFMMFSIGKYFLKILI